jgi:UDP-galactopyranose mutase
MRGNLYKCSHCKKQFIGSQTDEEAKAEMDANFGEYDGPIAVVCDDCYRKMIEVYPPKQWRSDVFKELPSI